MNNDIRLTSLILGGATIPLAGESQGVVATLTPDPTVVTQDGVSQRVYSHVNNATGTLTIVCFPQDAAHTIMLNLYRAQRATRTSALSGSGVMPAGNPSWSRGAITQAPEIRREETASTVTWTVAVDGLSL